MKVVFNDIIPFKGFMAMCLWPFIFVRNSASSRFNVVASNHEHIHGEQQKEMLILPFFIWYGLEFLFRLCQYRNWSKAYRNISFEREAYSNQDNIAYLGNRKHFAWFNYINRKSYEN